MSINPICSSSDAPVDDRQDPDALELDESILEVAIESLRSPKRLRDGSLKNAYNKDDSLRNKTKTVAGQKNLRIRKAADRLCDSGTTSIQTLSEEITLSDDPEVLVIKEILEGERSQTPSDLDVNESIREMATSAFKQKRPRRELTQKDKEYRAKWRKDHRESECARKKEYRKRNREAIKAYNKKYRERCKANNLTFFDIRTLWRCVGQPEEMKQKQGREDMSFINPVSFDFAEEMRLASSTPELDERISEVAVENLGGRSYGEEKRYDLQEEQPLDFDAFTEKRRKWIQMKKEYRIEWYKANRETELKKKKQYYQKNKEVIKKSCREYREKRKAAKINGLTHSNLWQYVDPTERAENCFLPERNISDLQHLEISSRTEQQQGIEDMFFINPVSSNSSVEKRLASSTPKLDIRISEVAVENLGGRSSKEPKRYDRRTREGRIEYARDYYLRNNPRLKKEHGKITDPDFLSANNLEVRELDEKTQAFLNACRERAAISQTKQPLEPLAEKAAALLNFCRKQRAALDGEPSGQFLSPVRSTETNIAKVSKDPSYDSGTTSNQSECLVSSTPTPSDLDIDDSDLQNFPLEGK